MTIKIEKAKYRNFSVAFEQMCSFVAISETQSPSETLKNLILQCFIVLPDEKFETAIKLKETINSLFGLYIAENNIQKCIEQLIKEKAITRPAGTNWTLTPDIKGLLQKRTDAANTLENKVKQQWFDEISKKIPNIPTEQAWSVLRKYLAKAFRRHGIQTAALLDPSVDVAPEYSESLSSLLNETVKDHLSHELHIDAKRAISGFLANICNYPERAEYISQLGDGAFNYFSLTVAPDVAENFRKKLNSLTLFFDTNVLIGILNLHVHPHVEVSNQLLTAIRKHKFPFTLRYHQATEAEILSTIEWYASKLRARTWSTTISRAAIKSPYLSGIELKYHQKNAEKGMDVESFLKPYKHIDILLKEKDILIHRTKEDRMYERATLLNEYIDFIKKKGMDKLYTVIDHDATVLDTVHQLRSNVASSLEAGALFITSDYNLYLFDWENSRRRGLQPCTVLPNHLFQILRPFIPSDRNFERSFAETFSLPEFRTIGSGASQACSKMLSILASLKDLPEDTAARLLSNDLLINNLRLAKNDKNFEEIVESALAGENALLLEEKVALAKQLELEREEKEAEKKKLDDQLRKNEAHLYEAQQSLIKKEEEIKIIESEVSKEKERLSEDVEHERRARERVEKQNKVYICLFATLVPIILILAFEFGIYWFEWNWLIHHPNSYGLQGAVDLCIFLMTFGFFFKKNRKYFWGGSLLPVILIILQLLGGPSSLNQSTPQKQEKILQKEKSLKNKTKITDSKNENVFAGSGLQPEPVNS
ncbi:MAG: hypothetical protein HYV24_10765 [Deltaproteobacteria bacterium]|nr:hypothetical protein [Deltaproteobacteria bacterium]